MPLDSWRERERERDLSDCSCQQSAQNNRVEEDNGRQS